MKTNQGRGIGGEKMGCCKPTQAESNAGAGQDKGTHCSGTKHMLLMMLCCLAPIGGLLLLRTIGYEGAANYLMFLLCPLMHLFMMKGMAKGDTQGASNDNNVGKQIRNGSENDEK